MARRVRHLPLSPRQAECVMLTCHGLRAGEIAARLGISRSTVAGHLAAAYERLGATGAGNPRLVGALRFLRQCERASGIRLGGRASEGQ